MKNVRSVKEIQAGLISVREELEQSIKKLELVALMTELERTYPEALDTERVGEGELCPPLAWEVHADVGNAKILLEEVVQSLEKASGRTEQEVHSEWLSDKLQEVPDPATRSLLGFFLGQPGESGSTRG